MPVKITVAGKMNDSAFHKCVAAVKYLSQEHPGVVTAEFLSFFETQWEEYIKKTANKLKGIFYQHSGSHIIILNDSEYVGTAEQFTHYLLTNFSYMDNSMSVVYDRLAVNTFKRAINTSKTKKYAQMQLNFSGMNSTIYFELFNDIAPKTVANFLGLCSGHVRTADQENLSYVGTEVNRIVKGM